MNYNIQIIEVILKITTNFFQRPPWIIGRIIMIALGSHMPNTDYEVFCFNGADSIVNDDDSFVGTHVFSQVY